MPDRHVDRQTQAGRQAGRQRDNEQGQVTAVTCKYLALQVSSNQRGMNASQLNIGGTGLGSFNDRFRDAVVGGSPFASPLFQGWVTGELLILCWCSSPL